MGDKSVTTLGSEIRFLVTFCPLPPQKQCWFFYFFDCTVHTTYTTLNWGAGGIRELMLDANEIEQMLNLSIEKRHFLSVSTTFVAHCSFPQSFRKFYGTSSKTQWDWDLWMLYCIKCCERLSSLITIWSAWWQLSIVTSLTYIAVKAPLFIVKALPFGGALYSVSVVTRSSYP